MSEIIFVTKSGMASITKEDLKKINKEAEEIFDRYMMCGAKDKIEDEEE